MEDSEGRGLTAHYFFTFGVELAASEAEDQAGTTWTSRLKRTISRTPEVVPRVLQVDVASESLNFTSKEALKESVKVCPSGRRLLALAEVQQLSSALWRR